MSARALTIVLAALFGVVGFAPRATAQATPNRVIVLTNGRIWTGDSANPWAEAVAIRDRRFVAVGATGEVMPEVGADQSHDLAGRLVVPGFIDGHTHFRRAGQLLLGVNLLDVSDDVGLRRRIAEADRRLPDGSWMVGGDWGAYDLESTWSPRLPLLDSITVGRPALLSKWDRSVFVANSAALQAAGIAPAGVAGALTADQVARIRRSMPAPAFEQQLAEARMALADLARHGVTSIHDITDAAQMRIYQYLKRRDSLSVRVCARPTLDHWNDLAATGIQTGYGDEWVSICGLKGFVDGIMGNSSAMFREPYRHRPDDRGRWRTMMSPPGNMESMIRAADSVGLTPHIHAIGDLAVDTLLDMFENVVRMNGTKDRRFRMIHAQVVEADDFARFGSLNLIAEINPYHAIDDMRWMEDRIGDRSRGAYAFRALKDGGALLVFGSDWPGTNAAWYPANPVLMIYAAVTRQTVNGFPDGGWYPGQRITVQEALEAATIAPAYAAFEETQKGKIAPGYYADLAVLSDDLFAVAPADLKDVTVLRTMVGGRWVYTADRLTP